MSSSGVDSWGFLQVGEIEQNTSASALLLWVRDRETVRGETKADGKPVPYASTAGQ
jgi:hypothetical protein